MTFIREKITSEEDLALYNSFKFVNPVYDVPAEPNYWKIDRERNAFLVSIGGGIEIPHFYAFVWNNNVIIFSVDIRINNNRETGETEWKWNILEFFAPKNLEQHNEEIIEMIKEAFITTLVLPIEERQKSKYFFEFKNDPQYILEEKGCNFGNYLGAL